MEAKFKTLKTADDLSILNGHAFEEYLRQLLTALGYQVEKTPGSGDFGADLVLEAPGERIAVQAKQYASEVGFDAVKEVHFAQTYYKANAAWVICTGGFTPQATQAAKETGVKLVTGEELERLIKLANDGGSLVDKEKIAAYEKKERERIAAEQEKEREREAAKQAQREQKRQAAEERNHKEIAEWLEKRKALANRLVGNEAEVYHLIERFGGGVSFEALGSIACSANISFEEAADALFSLMMKKLAFPVYHSKENPSPWIREGGYGYYTISHLQVESIEYESFVGIRKGKWVTRCNWDWGMSFIEKPHLSCWYTLKLQPDSDVLPNYACAKNMAMAIPSEKSRKERELAGLKSRRQGSTSFGNEKYFKLKDLDKSIEEMEFQVAALDECLQAYEEQRAQVDELAESEAVSDQSQSLTQLIEAMGMNPNSPESATLAAQVLAIDPTSTAAWVESLNPITKAIGDRGLSVETVKPLIHAARQARRCAGWDNDPEAQDEVGFTCLLVASEIAAEAREKQPANDAQLLRCIGDLIELVPEKAVKDNAHLVEPMDEDFKKALDSADPHDGSMDRTISLVAKVQEIVNPPKRGLFGRKRKH